MSNIIHATDKSSIDWHTQHDKVVYGAVWGEAILSGWSDAIAKEFALRAVREAQRGSFK